MATPPDAPTPPRRVTQKDIAARAGLSVATVSLALSDHPRLSEDTRAQVKRIAADLGYSPDPALSALAAHRSRQRPTTGFSTIALVSNWPERDAWTRRLSARELIAGASERARELGYQIDHFWIGDGRPGRCNDILRARGVRGIIVAPLAHCQDPLEFEWDEFSTVTIERPTGYPLLHHVVPNHYNDLLQCWEQLRRRGYTRIGLVVFDNYTARLNHQWEAAYGYAQGLASDSLDYLPPLQVSSTEPVNQIRAWLRQHRPQAIIARCDQVHDALAAEGLSTPDDIGYVGLNVVDDIPGIAGIDQHRKLIGATAVDILNSQLQRHQRGFQPVPISTQIDGTWRDGGSISFRTAKG